MDNLPPPPPANERSIDADLIQCGLDAQGFSVQYEEELQSIVIRIRTEAGATKQKFECIHRVSGNNIVIFDDPEMVRAYDAYVSEAERPQMLAKARQDLQDRGLLIGFPDRKNFVKLSDYIVALEKHAGFKPHSALRAIGDGITIDPPRASRGQALFTERYQNLLSVTIYACLLYSIDFGFIGNEYFAPPSDLQNRSR